MLSPEQVKEQLKEFRQADHLERQLERLRKAGPRVYATGQLLLKTGSEWQQVALQEQIPRLEQAHQRLAGFNPKERRELFDAMFPNLQPYVSQAWDLFPRLSYQMGWMRRPFRLPDGTSAERRQQWLDNLIEVSRDYEQDIEWFAEWAAYLDWHATLGLGVVFAAAVESQSARGMGVYEILVQSARGEHPVGRMGRHVVTALLIADYPPGWEFIERLLLAAQREEGLRQVILETVDEAHPAAFRRMLRLILEHNLERFSAVIRAVSVWIGLPLEAGRPGQVREILTTLEHCLDQEALTASWLDSPDPRVVYLSLWAQAFTDAAKALDSALGLLDHPDSSHRFAVVKLLGMLRLVGTVRPLLESLEDPALSVAGQAFDGLRMVSIAEYTSLDPYARLERFLLRLEQPKLNLSSPLWEHQELVIERDQVGQMMIQSLGKTPPEALLQHREKFSPHTRARMAGLLQERALESAEARMLLLGLCSDPSVFVRQAAFKGLLNLQITPQEAANLEALLTRKAADLRQGILRLLLGQPDRAVQASAGRLLGSEQRLQRQAGLHLLRQLIEQDRSVNESRKMASKFRGQRADLNEVEKNDLRKILGEDEPTPVLENALGLLEPGLLTPPTPIRAAGLLKKILPQKPLVTPAAQACVLALDDLVDQHRTAEIDIQLPSGAEEAHLLGNALYRLPGPNPDLPVEADLPRWFLRPVWEAWWSGREPRLRDEDGFELLRGLAPFFGLAVTQYKYLQDEERRLSQFLYSEIGQQELKYPQVVRIVLMWLLRAHPSPGAARFLVEMIQQSLEAAPLEMLLPKPAKADQTAAITFYSVAQARRVNPRILGWVELARWHRRLFLEDWQSSEHARFWELIRYLDEPKPDVPRFRGGLPDLLPAIDAGVAEIDNLYDLLIGSRGELDESRWSFRDLMLLTRPRPDPMFEKYPFLQEAVERCRERILEVELERGELPTAASGPALALSAVWGMETVVRFLKALGRLKIQRDSYRVGTSKAAVFSHLLRVSRRGEGDEADGFARLTRQANISEQRLVELAMHAPQWAEYVEHVLQVPRLADAVYWIYAHTKDRRWMVEQELRDQYAAEIGRLTPLTAEELLDGGVDVVWFEEVYQAVGAQRWEQLETIAHYASSGGGHTRARLFAQAMTGRLSRDELVERIREKRHQDSLRALGLLPLPTDLQAEKAELLQRYTIIQEFVRTGKKFGAQRQVSEKLAAEIGLQNLARNAGYRDPQRLSWAMEMEEISDLQHGPVRINVKDIQISLSIDDLGDLQLSASKGEQVLNSIPTRLNKEAGVQAIKARKQKLSAQVSRMRPSLEQAMIRGDTFSASELKELQVHPLLKPMIDQLVWLGRSSAGYLSETDEGQLGLSDFAGTVQSLRPDEPLRLAHPLDLYESGRWHDWQRECFIHERIQPFKQVFRECYLLTPAERETRLYSERYTGHQVNPRQALALLGSRGWIPEPGEGAYRTYHDQGVIAWVSFQQAWFTPAEVEDLTLDRVMFRWRKSAEALELAEVPGRIFSEVMRDLDLVVSVAHSGGVDPEATASTIEARAALVRETCSMLGIENVELDRRHALIQGQIGNYTVHLGSGVVHRQPGGMLCIIPVHSQQRGRIFLPFVDSDPRTAEVLSKVVLLARDRLIKDPTILEQILNR